MPAITANYRRVNKPRRLRAAPVGGVVVLLAAWGGEFYASLRAWNARRGQSSRRETASYSVLTETGQKLKQLAQFVANTEQQCQEVVNDVALITVILRFKRLYLVFIQALSIHLYFFIFVVDSSLHREFRWN